MKNANGTGSVKKLSGNRRNPYFAVAPQTYDKETGKPLPPRILSDDKGQKYFPDRKMPEFLRAKWNIENGNVNLDKTDYTFEQVYEEYASKNFPTKAEMDIERKTHQKAKGKLGKSITYNLQSAYKKCEKLYKKPYKSLRLEDYMDVIINTDGCATVIQSLANLFKKLDDYALSQDIILKGYAGQIKITDDLYKPVQNEGTPYTYDEIEQIWEHRGTLVADITLVTIYSGPRIEELLFTKIEDVHLEERYYVAGLKTTSGKRRPIPIHKDILQIIEYYYNINKDNEYLFTINNEKIDYDKQFYPMYCTFMDKLGMTHTSHDGRRTLHSEFARLKGTGIVINQLCVDRIFGHKASNFGDEVYSKTSLEELRQTIDKIDFRNNKNTKLTYLRVCS